MNQREEAYKILSLLEDQQTNSRELDSRIFRLFNPKYHDMNIHGGWLVGGNHPQPLTAPEYTKSINDAHSLFPEGAAVIKLGFLSDGQGQVYEMWTIDEDYEWGVQEPLKTPALALCHAAITMKFNIQPDYYDSWNEETVYG